MKKRLFLLFVVFLLAFSLEIPVSAGAITFGSRDLSIGMSGSDVSELQTHLKNFGFSKSRISGYFDKKTKSAVILFQKAYQLPADGVVNKDDYDRIAQLTQPQPPPPAPDPSPTPVPEPSPDPSPTPVPAPKRHVQGFYAVDYSGDVASYNSVQAYGHQMNSVVTFSFLVDGTGNITGSAPRDGVSLALSKGITPLALIHNYRNGGFNSTDAHNLLISSANRQRLINNTITIIKNEGYKGVNIDIENIPYADRPYYSALVAEFKAALQPLGLLTTVSIPAKTSEGLTNSWSGAFDYAAIGKNADWIQIMTYDEHWFGGTPGPIASLPWVENVIKYAISMMPKEKILLGIATYGYDWTATTTKVVTYSSVKTLISTYNVVPQWSSTYGVPYFIYYQNGVKHEVWYENADSARLKFDLVNKYGLMGIGIWRLGYEDATFWQAVAEKLQQ